MDYSLPNRFLKIEMIEINVTVPEETKEAVRRALDKYFPDTPHAWREELTAKYVGELLVEGRRRLAEFAQLTTPEERVVYLGALSILPRVGGHLMHLASFSRAADGYPFSECGNYVP